MKIFFYLNQITGHHSFSPNQKLNWDPQTPVPQEQFDW
jgi:hypothetical protein